MKKLSVFLCAIVLVFGVAGTANSALQTIGTATYNGSDYNLIYEDDSIDGGLVWLDYTNSHDNWQNQVNWVSGIGSDLTVNLYPGYTTSIDWSTDWRLPLTQDESSGYNQTGSEMGHLYYESLGNVAYDVPGFGLNNTGDFINLQLGDYWSGTEYSPSTEFAWRVCFMYGDQYQHHKFDGYYALAVHPGTVDVVPIPGIIWLLGSGLIVFAGYRKKIHKGK